MNKDLSDNLKMTIKTKTHNIVLNMLWCKKIMLCTTASGCILGSTIVNLQMCGFDVVLPLGVKRFLRVLAKMYIEVDVVEHGPAKAVHHTINTGNETGKCNTGNKTGKHTRIIH